MTQPTKQDGAVGTQAGLQKHEGRKQEEPTKWYQEQNCQRAKKRKHLLTKGWMNKWNTGVHRKRAWKQRQEVESKHRGIYKKHKKETANLNNSTLKTHYKCIKILGWWLKSMVPCNCCCLAQTRHSQSWVKLKVTFLRSFNPKSGEGQDQEISERKQI